MNILVLNCGSSTLKFQLIKLDAERSARKFQRKLARGIVDRIGGDSLSRFEAVGTSAMERRGTIASHEEAVEQVIAWLNSAAELRAIDAVGHRVVHGGDRFTSSARIDDGVLDALESLCELAPLHNPPSVSGIRAARSVLGGRVPMVAAFDTSFHHTIPEHAAIYAIPFELSVKHRIRRYGFHGLAHEYSALRYAELTGLGKAEVNIVTLHLGNGCSACAVRHGKSIDTSMGFTPLEGLVMGTRSGDLDPALVSYLARKEGAGPDEVESLLNRRSGLLGISGVSNDMRELAATYSENPRSRLAVEAFCYRARKYLGAYLSVLERARAVVFSGGIGERSPWVRGKICEGMGWCGLQLDFEANDRVNDQDTCISPPDAKIKVYVVHTDEETIIAQETAGLVAKS